MNRGGSRGTTQNQVAIDIVEAYFLRGLDGGLNPITIFANFDSVRDDSPPEACPGSRRV